MLVHWSEKKPTDIIRDFKTARPIKNDRAIFELAGMLLTIAKKYYIWLQ
jgi:hypothetical protein